MWRENENPKNLNDEDGRKLKGKPKQFNGKFGKNAEVSVPLKSIVPLAPVKLPRPAPREGSIEITGPRVSPTVSASQRNVLNKRKKLLRRIRISMLNQQKVVTSKGYAFRSKINLKGGSKHDRTRLREKQLRSRYLRHRERPANSYLYVHNKPKKARQRLSSLKSTVSPKGKH